MSKTMKKELISLAMAALATLAAFGVIVACCEPSTIKAMHFWTEDAR